MKLIFLIFLLALLPLSLAFTCSVKESCSSNEIAIASLAKLNNSHAGGPANYTYKVCCDFYSASIKESCSSDEGEVFSLYKLTNSHIAKPGYYSNKVCARFEGAPANCSIRESCYEDETCVISLAKEYNAHAAACDYYPYKICCKKYADLFINQTSISFNTTPYVGETLGINITVWNIGEVNATNVNISCYDNGEYFDSYLISLIEPDSSFQKPAYAYCELQTSCPVEQAELHIFKGTCRPAVFALLASTRSGIILCFRRSKGPVSRKKSVSLVEIASIIFFSIPFLGSALAL